MPCIYRIISPSGKSYIGQTGKTLEKRLYGHRSPGSNCILLRRAKYGWDHMKAEVLLYCNKEDLNEYERAMITAYDTMAPNGYNCSSGGEVNKVVCESTKQRISIAGKRAHREGKFKHVKLSEAAKLKRIKESNGCISFRKQKQKWSVIIPEIWSEDHKQHTIGLFATKMEAQEALTYFKNNNILSEEIKLFQPRKRSKNMDNDEKKMQSIRRKPTGSVSYQKRWYARIPKWWSDTNTRKCIGTFASECEAWNAIEAWKLAHNID